jgi:hypothetical protein
MAGPSSSRYSQVAGSSALSDLTADEDVGFATSAKPQFSWTPPYDPSQYTPPPGSAIGGAAARLGVTPRPAAQQLDSNAAGRILGGLSPEQFFQVQQQLYTRGLYADSYYGKTPRPVNWGAVGDNDTLSAFRSAAILAGFTGNLDQILSGPPSAQALLAGQGGGRARAPLVIELPSAEDLGAVLRQSASKLLGRDPTPAELSAFVADFQADSSAYQREAYGKATGGGTVNRPPSADTAAESFLKEKAPVEAGAQKMESGLGVLLRMFGGGGG